MTTYQQSPVHVEVNPAKESDLDLIEQSVRTLQACCDSIMDSLQSKRDLIPASFRRLCHFIRVNVEEALGSDAHAGETDESLAPSQKVLSAFMFLRLIVPTVMAPVEKALFLPSQVPSNKAGSLVYVSKVSTEKIVCILIINSRKKKKDPHEPRKRIVPQRRIHAPIQRFH